MKTILILLWMIIFPIATSVNELINIKIKNLLCHPLASEDDREFTHIIEWLVFIVVIICVLCS